MKKLKIFFIVGIVFSLFACSSDSGPNKSEIENSLSIAIPAYLSVTSFKIEASHNLGTEVEPSYQTRFRATLKLNADTFHEHKEKRLEHVMFLERLELKGKEVDVYGKSLSRLHAGSWRTSIDIDGNPIHALGKPISMFSSHKVLIVGSQEEKKYFDEQKRIAEKKRLAEEEERTARMLAEEKEIERQMLIAEKRRLAEGKEREARRIAKEKEMEKQNLVAEKRRLAKEKELKKKIGVLKSVLNSKKTYYGEISGGGDKSVEITFQEYNQNANTFNGSVGYMGRKSKAVKSFSGRIVGDSLMFTEDGWIKNGGAWFGMEYKLKLNKSNSKLVGKYSHRRGSDKLYIVIKP